MKYRILNILPFLPWPLATGGHNGCYHSIEAMRNLVDLYVLFPFANNQKDIEHMKDLWPEVTWLPYKRKCKFSRKTVARVRSLYDKVQKLFYGGYNQTLEWNFQLDSERYEDEYLDSINDYIRKYNIDIVQIEFPFMMSLVAFLPKNVKKVFVHHELRFVRNELTLQSGNITNAYYKFYAAKSKIEEIAYLNQYDHVVTFSPVDKDKLIEAGVTVPCSASFLIVDSRKNAVFKPATNRMTFLGSGGHMPNNVGLNWFLEKEWREMLKINPELTLSIIGNWSVKIQKEILDKYHNINFLGFVDNLQNVMTESVMIVPITIGSGIRIKILECASIGVPFVSTNVGVEGLPFKDGVDCFIADNSKDFSRKILTLLEDKVKQKEFSENSLKIMGERYSKEAFQKSRMCIYNNLYEK